ncbi:MAG: proline--tRNA ligase [bacterium]
MKINSNNIVTDGVRITPREKDYSQWYLDIIKAADLAEYGPVKGTMIIKPDGLSIWEKIKQVLDERFFDLGVKNMYFPMLIPERFLKKEESHVEGFSPEVAVVTYAGGEKLEEALVIRPTSETIIYDSFSKWIQSYNDLPLLMNQWANVVRWELRPRLFLRTTEFLWQEGHTAHQTNDDADSFAKTILDIYKNLAEEFMAIPVVVGEKSDSEKFAGADKTYTVEAMMSDGKSLQFATSHNLGQNFSKAFNIQFSDENNNKIFVWQTSWGLSTRTIGGLIMVHSDDKGLVLPPKIAPVRVVIIPVWGLEKDKENVLRVAQELHDKLVLIYDNRSIVIDETNARLGYKHYFWEKKGVPLRIEIGPRDIKNNSVVIVRRDLSEKENVATPNLTDRINFLLEDIQQNLYKRAKDKLDLKTVQVTDWKQFVVNIEKGNFVIAYWDGTKQTEEEIKKETKSTVRCILEDITKSDKNICVFSGQSANKKALFARNY